MNGLLFLENLDMGGQTYSHRSDAEKKLKVIHSPEAVLCVVCTLQVGNF